MVPYTSCVTRRKSSDAPVVTSPKKTCSAARPAKAMHTISMICSRLRKKTSLGRYWANPKAPLVRGIMVTFSKGSACSKNHPATAWPASWCATTDFSWGLIILCDSNPPMIRSVAFSKSSTETDSALRRAATIAASLHKLAMSAPAKPGVKPAKRPAISSILDSNLIPFKCTSKISLRPIKSGLSTVICRSKRPGRVRAESKISTRFVPASTTTPVEGENPSISTNS
mmetsp:Transcript_11763/g.22583  ORF Transcript_11763/g.22583 Transcript_11763/m.22583 type:complete len:227 (-) Transcript_11763:238-918(-)